MASQKLHRQGGAHLDIVVRIHFYSTLSADTSSAVIRADRLKTGSNAGLDVGREPSRKAGMMISSYHLVRPTSPSHRQCPTTSSAETFPRQR